MSAYSDAEFKKFEERVFELEVELIRCRSCNLTGRSLCSHCKGTGWVKKSDLLERLKGNDKT